MQRTNRRSIALFFMISFAFVACSDSESTGEPTRGTDCVRDSDCNAKLVCRFARCHEECKVARDCEDGEMCVLAENRVRVCLLVEEASCLYDSECPSPLVCAEDFSCRNECMADIDCATETQMCVQPGGVCAEPEDIVDGRLKLMSIDAGDGAMGDASMSMDASQDGAMSEMDASQGSDSGASTDGATSDGAAGGGGNDSGSTAAYFEDDTGEEPEENDTREQALPLPEHGSIYVPVGDEDWFWFDTPDDGKAHVLELVVAQDQATRVYIAAFAGADDSMIGNVLQEAGTTKSTFISAGPNARTLVRFDHDVTGRADFTWTMTTEIDDYEPNNTRDQTSPIDLDTEIEAQQIRAYIRDADQYLADWYAVELQPGTLTFDVLRVPSDVGLWVGLMNPNGAIARIGQLMPGVIGSFTANIPTAGTYLLQVTNHSNSQITSFTHGAKPEHLTESYAFKVTVAP